MNHIYRVVWNRTLKVLQVASELTHSHGGDASGGASTWAPGARRALSLACATALAMGAAGFTPPAWAASTYSVTLNTDDGLGTTVGSLSWAVAQANAESGSTIDVSAVSGPITETATLPPLTESTTLVGNLQIVGTGAAPLVNGTTGTLWQIGDGTATSSITGSGGNAGSGSSVGNGGVGSGGGNAVTMSAGTTLNVMTNGFAAGGAGGGGGSTVTGNGGDGGAGANAITSSGSFTLTNAGTIAGGAGGAGGQSTSGHGGNGGNGGTAVNGSGFTLTNAASGRIDGGNGGGGGFSLGGSGSGGSMGTALVSTGNSTVINAGSISGGTAVHFSNGGNALTLEVGSTTTGAIVSTSGSTNGGDSLTLGDNTSGGGSDSLDIGAVSGFTTYQKTGTSTWTLTGAGNTSENWAITGGTLQGDATALVGNITFTPAVGDTAAVVFDQGSGNSNSPATATYAGVISGDGGVNKIDDGTLILSNTNTYSGGTTISSGTLQIGNGGTTGSVAGDITDNGTLTFNRSNAVTIGGVISGTGALTQAGSGTLTLTGTNTYTGQTNVNSGSTLALGGTGSVATSSGVSDNGLTLSGGTLTLTGANTYTGLTTISGGTLQIGNGSTTGSIVGGVTDNGTLTFNRSDAVTMSGVISGTGALTQAGSGTLILTGTNTYTGLTAISAGTLQIGNGGTTGSVAGDITDNGTLTFNRSDALTIGGVISGNGALTQAGSGTLILTGINTYTGQTNVSSGSTLALRGTGSVATSSGVSDNGTFDISGTSTGTTIKSLAGSGTVALGGKTLTISNSTGTFGGIIGGAGGGLTLSGGTLTLTGANTYTGLTTISGGTLQIGNGGTTGSIVGNVADDGTLLVNRSNAVTYAGVISGNGALTQAGSGTLKLTGTNTYLGGTTISAGTLQLGDGALGHDGTVNGGIQVASGAEFAMDYLGSIALANVVTGNGTVSLESGGAITEGAGIRITASDLIGQSVGATALNEGNLIGTLGSFSAAGFALTNAQNLTVTGPVNGGASTSLTTTAGDLAIDGAVNGATTTLTSAGAITEGAGGVITAGTLTGQSGGSTSLLGANQVGALGAFTTGGDFGFNDAQTLTVNNAPSANGGAGNLTLTTTGGNSDLILSSNVTGNKVTLAAGRTLNQTAGVIEATTLTGSSVGDTTLDGANLIGTLGSFTAAGFALTNAQSLAVFGAVDGGTSTSLTTTTGDLAINGAVNGSTITLTSAGAISEGAGGVITAGTLSGSSVGNTVLNGANQIGTLGSFSAANFALTNAQALTLNGALSAADISLDDSAGIFVTGAINATDKTTIAHGTLLQIGNGGITGAITGNVVDNGALAFDHSDAVNFAGAISGNGALTQRGVDTLTLDGNSSAFLGTTTVQTGKLVVGSAAGNGAALGGNVTVDSGATLGGHGSIGGNVVVANGAHLAPGNSIGTLTIGGDFTAAQGSVLDYEFGASGASFTTSGNGDSVKVGGNLELDGATLNVTDAGGFGPGLYNLFTYGGTLTESNGGIALGTTPGGTYTIQNLSAQKQINLFNTTGLTLNLWNGNGLASSTQMGGGNGTWSSTAPNWTDATGSTTAVMQPQPGFAIFGGAEGTVTVGDSGGASQVSATGLQFASNGYTLRGDALTLVGSGGAAPIVRVGDGSAAGAGYTATISSVLAGTSGLNKTDLGNLVLTGANTYSGGTTISGAELSVASDTNLGAASGGLTLDGGSLQVTGSAFQSTTRSLILGNAGGGFNIANAGNTFTVAQVLSGTGALTKTGAGTLALTGANSYSGGTTISAGTLQGDTTSLQGDITDNATLAFAQNTTGTFAGTLSGGGALTKTGAALLVLDGHNTFTGITTVQSGTLEVGDASTPAAFLGGNVDVAANGTLRGHGTIGGNVVNAGTLWPGGSIGTLTVQGNYTQSVGSTFNIDATPAGQASLLTVGGRATILGGSTVVLAQTGNWAPQTDYTILTAAGGVSGQFATATSSLAFLDPVLTYTANAVNLSLQRNDISFSTVAQTPNQRAVADAASTLGYGNPLYATLVKLDAPTAQHAFNQITGEIHASTRTALVDDSRYVRDAVNRHLLGLDHNGVEGTTAQGTSVWASTWGHGGHHDGDGNATSVQANGSDLLVGTDLMLGGNTRLGAVLGHGQNSVRANSLGSSTHVLGDHLGVYASSAFGAFVLRAGAMYSWQDVHSNRAVAFGDYGDWLTSKYDAQTAQAYVEGGYQFNVSPGQQLEPFVNLARVRVHDDTLQEGGGAAALAVTGNSMSVNTATLGLRDTLVLDAAGDIHAHVSLAWQQAWGDLTPLSTMRFAGGSDSFAIAGVPVARHAVTTNIGIDFKVAKNVTVGASYLGQFASGVRDQGAHMSLTVTF